MKQGALKFTQPDAAAVTPPPEQLPSPCWPVSRRYAFAAGDQVRPKREWPIDHKGNPIPSGRVVKVEPWGLGQIVFLEGHEKRPLLGGFFDPVSEAAS